MSNEKTSAEISDEIIIRLKALSTEDLTSMFIEVSQLMTFLQTPMLIVSVTVLSMELARRRPEGGHPDGIENILKFALSPLLQRLNATPGGVE